MTRRRCFVVCVHMCVFVLYLTTGCVCERERSYRVCVCVCPKNSDRLRNTGLIISPGMLLEGSWKTNPPNRFNRLQDQSTKQSNHTTKTIPLSPVEWRPFCSNHPPVATETREPLRQVMRLKKRRVFPPQKKKPWSDLVVSPKAGEIPYAPRSSWSAACWCGRMRQNAGLRI